jgi:hypothetical protein
MEGGFVSVSRRIGSDAAEVMPAPQRNNRQHQAGSPASPVESAGCVFVSSRFWLIFHGIFLRANLSDEGCCAQGEQLTKKYWRLDASSPLEFAELSPWSHS